MATKLVRELRAGDTIRRTKGSPVTILDIERLGYGKWRVTLSPVNTNTIETCDVPGDCIVHINESLPA